MPHPEHLEILKRGCKAWNYWRNANKHIIPNLSGANLCARPLDDFDFNGTVLNGANLDHASMDRVNLTKASLRGVSFCAASLNWACLAYANLCDANFSFAYVIETDLSNAVLSGTIFNNTLFGQTNFAGAKLTQAVFTSVDLRTVRGLDSATHGGPSSIGIDTLYKSHGEIPEDFLRDAGISEEAIDLARSIRCGPPIQWYSCFISYSTKDEEFARRLHARMRQANMNVYFAPEDLKGGEKLHEQLFRAIQLNDKVLLVLSEYSVKSEWVMTEIRKAREVARKEKRRKLFPIRLVDLNTLQDWTCFDADSGKDLASEVREYFIPDFSNWKNHDAFEKAFAKLQIDLKADTLQK